MGSEQYSQFYPLEGDMRFIERDRGEDCVVISICPSPLNLFDVGIGSCDRTIWFLPPVEQEWFSLVWEGDVPLGEAN